jgi:hypothetical protein
MVFALIRPGGAPHVLPGSFHGKITRSAEIVRCATHAQHNVDIPAAAINTDAGLAKSRHASGSIQFVWIDPKEF